MAAVYPTKTLTDHLCECGCGAFTFRIMRKSVASDVIGMPRRFLKGHSHVGRRSKAVVTRYRFALQADVNGKVQLLHRVRAARALGHDLPPKAVVHHADGTRSDDSPLVICQDSAYHKLLHARMRVQAAGGNPNTEKHCGYCGQAKPFAAFHKNPRTPLGLTPYCRACMSALWKANDGAGAQRRRRQQRAKSPPPPER